MQKYKLTSQRHLNSTNRGPAFQNLDTMKDNAPHYTELRLR